MELKIKRGYFDRPMTRPSFWMGLPSSGGVAPQYSITEHVILPWYLAVALKRIKSLIGYIRAQFGGLTIGWNQAGGHDLEGEGTGGTTPLRAYEDD